ncbi:MAG: GLPGLI family protein [Chitinophagaceae bacterium]|nr:GLPGLI family protein [Chitinophagaceae bacterium]MCB9045242.1 GLPGLI family protein [Chitinophagales bacterium]
MKKLYIILFVLLTVTEVKAQHTQEGKIEYVRSTNLHRMIDQMDDEDKEWINKMRSQIPVHNVHYFDLYFTPKHSLYKPGKESEQTVNFWFARTPAAENIVYTDFLTGNVTAQKQVYEEKFLVKDSMRKIKWTIKDEVRTIAEYKCRKAVGVMYDSVYVIAFYTEDIPASGGPEMFGMLPGMIMEVAVPRLHTTWIASKVEYIKPDEKELVPPKKGKETTQKEMQSTLSTSLQRWGKFADRAVWWSLL